MPLRRSVSSAGATTVARNALAVASGLAVAQVLAYGFTVAMARVLGPADFGALSALLAVILIANVVALGVQAVGARLLVTTQADRRSGVAAAILARAWRWALATAATIAVATPVLAALLHVGATAVLATAVGLVPLVLAGALLGTTQGVEAMGRLGVLHALLAAGRAVGGVAAALALGSVTATMSGYALGLVVAVGVGAWVARPRRARADRGPLVGFDQETAHAAHALLALFVLGSVDVLLARAMLPPVLAGEYAVGAIVAKIAFWLPQFVVQVAFPRMASVRRRRQTTVAAALAVGAIGLVVVGVTAAFSTQIVAVVGGDRYAAVAPSLWLFAATGAMVALAQVLLYSRIAGHDRRAALVVWLGVALLTGLVVTRLHHSVTQVVSAALVSATVVVTVGALRLFAGDDQPVTAA